MSAPVVDTETHVMVYARNYRTNRDNPHSTRLKHLTWHEHDADLLVQEMDAAGVDHTFLISYDGIDCQWGSEQKGFAIEDFAGGRKHTLQGVRQFPDRFLWFSTLKDVRRWPTHEMIELDLEDGAVGFKLFPAFVKATLDSDDWMGVFERIAAAESRLLISFEVTKPPHTHSLDEFMAQLGRVLAAFPSLPVALLHAGCADPLTERGKLVSELCAEHENVYLSCSMPGEVWDDGVEYPFRNLLRRVEALALDVGTARLMWATDWPWFEDRFKYQQGIDCFRKHADFLDERGLEQFLGGTAMRFLGRDV